MEILVQWSEDRRNSSDLVGARWELVNWRAWTGRKLVRLDRKARVLFPPKAGEIQPCRIVHDTQPGDDGRGVLFVVPTAPGKTFSEKIEEEKAKWLVKSREDFESVYRNSKVENLISGHLYREGVYYTPPSFPDFRYAEFLVRDGVGEVWSYDWEPGTLEKVMGKKLLELPELGVNEQLEKNLIENWPSTMSPTPALERAKALGLAVGELTYTVEHREQSSVIYWSAALGREGRVVPFGKSYQDIPGPDADFAGIRVPEVEGRMERWAKDYLDRNAPEGDRVYTGVVTTKSFTTRTYEYTSPDERGTRIGGGDMFVTVLVEGEAVGSVNARFWEKAKGLLGIVEGQPHSGISPQQLNAIHTAYADMWRFGTLGPRGAEAVLRAGGVP